LHEALQEDIFSEIVGGPIYHKTDRLKEKEKKRKKRKFLNKADSTLCRDETPHRITRTITVHLFTATLDSSSKTSLKDLSLDPYLATCRLSQ
jgi:hypothetical protein